jgi:hypothetical protein
MRIVNGIKLFDADDISEGKTTYPLLDFFVEKLIAASFRTPTIDDAKEFLDEYGLQMDGWIETSLSSPVFEPYSIGYICEESMSYQILLRQIEKISNLLVDSPFFSETIEDYLNNITDDLDAHIFNLSEDEAALHHSIIFLFKEYQGRKMLVDIFSGYPANIKSKFFSDKMSYYCDKCYLFKSAGKNPHALNGWVYKMLKPTMEVKYLCPECFAKINEQEEWQRVGQ